MSGLAADDLLRGLILKRFAERYEQFPYCVEHHILHCGTREVADHTHQQTFSCCESCPYVVFTALIWCQHAQVEYEYEESGRLEWLLADLAAAEESAIEL